MTYAEGLTDAERADVDEALKNPEVFLVIDFPSSRTLAAREVLTTGACLVGLRVPMGEDG